MMRVRLTRACRGGHPMYEVASQSFEAPALERLPTERHRSTCHTLPQQSDLTASQHQLHPAETPPRGKKEVSSLKPIARGT
jgi:hypothetical protein